MARTVRSIIQAAQRKFGALVSGDNTSADEMTDGLEAYNGLVRAIQGGIGSRLSNQPALTVSATAEVGGLYRGPASSITITCPANPRHGARFGVADVNADFSIHNYTIAKNGALLEGAAANLTLSTNGDARVWFFEGDTGNWVKEADVTDVSTNCIFPDRFAGPLSDMLAAYWCQEFGGELRGDTLLKALEGQEAFVRQYGRRGPNALDRPIKTRPSGGAQG
jgi:hypothetical protein